MGGKSTFMRQCALIVYLAHIGCYVPAKQAILGPIDRIFTRIGAHDSLVTGQSTFMMEMIETATIIRESTNHSLVLLDEIGRGTSTHDGLAIAQAAAEHLLHYNRSWCLFSTHYHELTQWAQQEEHVKNYHLGAQLTKETLHFTYKLQEGAAKNSFGLHVAKMAGLPTRLLERARNYHARYTAAIKTHQKEHESEQREHPLLASLIDLDLDGLSPRQAYDYLHHWQEKLKTNQNLLAIQTIDSL
jgi:DNA mismatch repair protein MutS